MKAILDKDNIWKAFFMILAALLGYGTSEVVDTVQPADCPECPIVSCAACPDCPDAMVIAYQCDGTKLFCDCFGEGCPCRTTEEILSELG